VILLTAGCSEKQDPEPTEADLQVFVDRFFAEASARNIEITDKLTLRLVDASEIAPYAALGNPDPPLLRVAREFWNHYSESQKEIIIFHELANVKLEREPTSELLPGCKYFKSLMNSEVLDVYESETDSYRQYYIDELFDPFTPSPSWADAPKTTKHLLFDDDSTFHFNNSDVDETEVRLAVSAGDIPQGASVKITVQVKSSNLSIKGAGVILEADPEVNEEFAASTIRYGLTARITGTSDWHEYHLTLHCYPPGNPDMFVRLYIDPNATGDVWFKDVEVGYYD
jgi:hypothetical protein